ncbi:MAG: hypothetical protein LKI42_02785, partial [Bacteroidales bacterium]|nr:hypothetical protein [Bacteroidales bacterium]
MDGFLFFKDFAVSISHFRIMKYVMIIILSLFSENPSSAKDSTLIMFWNLENFFDYRDSGNGTADTEFSSTGQRHWTKKRFYAKCNAIAKAIMWIGSEKGRMPDIIGVAEVENRFVLERLVYATALKKYDYGVVHYESPDPRGIDVGLLYRRSFFKVLSSRRCPVTDSCSSGTPLLTRDILEVKLKKTEGDGGRGDSGSELILLVNHHPSKYGGDSGIWRRKVAMA